MPRSALENNFLERPIPSSMGPHVKFFFIKRRTKTALGRPDMHYLSLSTLMIQFTSAYLSSLRYQSTTIISQISRAQWAYIQLEKQLIVHMTLHQHSTTLTILAHTLYMHGY